MKINRKLYEANELKDIREIINNAIEKFPDNNAFIIKNKNEKDVTYKNITYKKFGEDIEAFGTALIDKGLRNSRIAIIGKNRYEWVLSYITILSGVGIVVPLDKGLPEIELESLLKRSKADIIIFEKEYIEIMKKIKLSENLQIKEFICMNEDEMDFTNIYNLIEEGKRLLNNNDTRFNNSIIEKDKLAAIIFTSGTTTISKGVMLSQRNIANNVYNLNCTEKVYSNDVNLVFLPLHHTFGSIGMLFFLNNGVTNVFCDGLRHIQSNLKEYKVSIFVSVPLLLEAMYKKINIEIEKQGKTKIIKIAKKISNILLKFKIDIRRKLFKQIINNLGGNIRFVINGASAIDKNVAQGFNDFGILTVQGYGLTETAPVLASENAIAIRYGSVGLAMPDVEIKIDKPNEDGIGEIIVKGPNVMLGYYEDEQATKEVIVDGWFHTGDLGYIDKDEFLFITGRKKNVIVLKNGKNVYPEEIELLISNLPYVTENMVFGKKKEEDLLVSAKIVYNKEYIEEKYPNIDETKLKEIIWQDIKLVNNKLPSYKHIKNLIITDEPMVKTTTAKIKRFEEIKKTNIIK